MHQCVSSPRQALSSRDRVVAASSSLKVFPVRPPPKKRQHAPLGNSVIETQIVSSRLKARAWPRSVDHVTSWPSLSSS